MKSNAYLMRPLLFMIVLFQLPLPIKSSAKSPKGISGLEVNDRTAVRFLLRRPNANYVLPPLIFRVAGAGNSDLNTAPIDQRGRSPYISLQEMKRLVRSLEEDHLLWQISSPAASIEPFEEIVPNPNLFITIYSEKGMATSSISPNAFCRILSRANQTIEVKRAHWEFEYFRRGCGCKVPGYKGNEYPNAR